MKTFIELFSPSVGLSWDSEKYQFSIFYIVLINYNFRKNKKNFKFNWIWVNAIISIREIFLPSTVKMNFVVRALMNF